MPPPPPPPPHNLRLKTPAAAALPDVIFTAFSLFVLFSTSPKHTHIFSIQNNKLSFPLNPNRKSIKYSNIMSSPFRNPNRRPPPPFASPEVLSDWLRPRLPSDSFASWGVKSGTKNVHNLWLELAEGETSLDDSVPPIRTVEVVIVRVIRNEGKQLLIESHQELSDGAVRHRSRPLSEKMKPGESVEAAVFRAVKEELGSILEIRSIGNSDFSEIVNILPNSYVKKVEERVSASYPGLPACYLLHSVDAEVAGLPEGEFSTVEANEYENRGETSVADDAVSCKKHYWKWVDYDSI